MIDFKYIPDDRKDKVANEDKKLSVSRRNEMCMQNANEKCSIEVNRRREKDREKGGVRSEWSVTTRGSHFLLSDHAKKSSSMNLI